MEVYYFTALVRLPVAKLCHIAHYCTGDGIIQRCMCSDHHLCVSYRRATKWYNKFKWNAFIARWLTKMMRLSFFLIFKSLRTGQQRAAATKTMILPQDPVLFRPVIKSSSCFKTCNFVFLWFFMNGRKIFKPKNFNKGPSLLSNFMTEMIRILPQWLAGYLLNKASKLQN